MPGNVRWKKVEGMKIVWEIIKNEVIEKTAKGTSERKQLIDKIAILLLNDPDFKSRALTNNPIDTMSQHIRMWINYLENKEGSNPTLTYEDES